MPQISQEELDKLRASSAGNIGPLGRPEGEGLAARSIADYLRGGGGGGPRGPLGGGGLSYGQGGANSVPNWQNLAARRGQARDAGASISQLQQADAQNRDNRAYNKRQQAALDLAWQSSPDKVKMDAANAQRAKEGKPLLQRDGVNTFHVRPDGSRDFNYSADGQYRGAIPEEFRNAAGDPNTHDAHFNRETGQWEAGDLSLSQTFKDIGKGFTDAYGNIRSTIPMMGANVWDAVKGIGGGGVGGEGFFTGGGADGLGNRGLAGDAYGKLTNQFDQATADRAKAVNAANAAKAASNPNLSTAKIAAKQFHVNPVFTAPAPRRDRPSNDAAAANSRSQIQKKNTASARRASARSGGGGALHGGGRNSGGWIHRNMGGPLSRRDEENERAAIAQSNVVDSPVQQAPRVAQSGGGAGGGGGGSPIAGLAMKFLPKLFGLNTGGGVPNVNGYNEGGSTQATPIKKEMDIDKMRMAREAFEKKEMRADEAHKQQMTLKQQQAKQAMTMKKDAATMKAPLSKST